MITSIPAYIKDRIRQPIPINLKEHIVANSIPVIFFGNIHQASVATISINPSNKEFLNNNQKELVGKLKRFETLTSLQIRSLENADNFKIEAIYNSCLNYFDLDKGRRPYTRWFNSLEDILKKCNVSYYNSSACHLDLVQWATSKKWKELEPDIKQKFLKQDVPFLKKLLENNINLKVILLNGRTTLETVIESLELNLNLVNYSLICKTKQGNKKYEIYEGTYEDKIKVIGWTSYIQNLRCNNSKSLKKELAGKVKELMSDK